MSTSPRAVSAAVVPGLTAPGAGAGARTAGRRVARAVGYAGAAGVGLLGYAGLYERRAFTLRRLDVPVLARDADPLRVLHLSDLHMMPGQRGKQAWLRELARLTPDLVVLTGDLLSAVDAGPAVMHAMEPLFSFPGAFVPGNNDYWAPRVKNPMLYFVGSDDRPRKNPLNWAAMASQLSGAGWWDLTNVRTELTVAGRRLDVRGVDDPYLERDDLPAVAGPADPTADLRLGVAHTPEPRVLDAFTADGVDLMVAGHTHGGQLRLPGYGALVTNCGIDRPRARGLSAYGARGHVAALHVSAGIGTSPYAPVRFACRPEATLLTLVGSR